MQEREYDTIRALRWADDALWLLDQRLLPVRTDWVRCTSAASVTRAIRDMVVRGAPAIGIAAAYGVVLAVMAHYGRGAANWRQAVEGELRELAAARPTAVNLGWAVARMRKALDELWGDPREALLEEAQRIHREDLEANYRMGDLGAALLDGAAVLTHCNAGALATGGYGTALGVVRSGWARGTIRKVYAGETRPWLQGARLTAWELVEEGIPVHLLCDGAAATLMRRSAVQWVVVGADRVAANGDVANKIGTYALAVLARHHGVRFMVVAPTTTVDLATPAGRDIPIEMRAAEELRTCGGRPVAPDRAEAWNPVFDVTPAELIDVLVTERGVVERPTPARLAELLAGL
ncbi:MAG TPA: S-methyl-5-thioribose-1-phosphate isomerase [Chromatiales bacterium]|nr:S-methyl-5-thioribose-1-phosphate isomerase [Chromatiales bacterium]